MIPIKTLRDLLRDPLFRAIVAGGGILLLLAFAILRYEGFFAAICKLLRVLFAEICAVRFYNIEKL